MALLVATPAHRHRKIFPGELRLVIGSSSPRKGISFVSHPSVQLLHFNDASGYPDAVGEDAMGQWQLLAKNREPIFLSVDSCGEPLTPEVLTRMHPGLVGLVGRRLADELDGHLRQMLAQHDGKGVQARCLRFANISQYIELILGLWKRTDPHFNRQKTLLELSRVWGSGQYGAQMKWYENHGPSKRGETKAAYKAEVAAFEVLARDNRAAIERQLPQRA
jgi:hypothetical protein